MVYNTTRWPVLCTGISLTCFYRSAKQRKQYRRIYLTWPILFYAYETKLHNNILELAFYRRVTENSEVFLVKRFIVRHSSAKLCYSCFLMFAVACSHLEVVNNVLFLLNMCQVRFWNIHHSCYSNIRSTSSIRSRVTTLSSMQRRKLFSDKKKQQASRMSLLAVAQTWHVIKTCLILSLSLKWVLRYQRRENVYQRM